MIHPSLRPHIMIGWLVALLLLITAAGGLVDHDLYSPFFSSTITRFQRLQDALSLLLAPALVWAMFIAARGSLRGLVIWGGILVYVAYYYSFYVFDFAYTVYYPLYIALLGLSVYSLSGLLAGVAIPVWRARVGGRIPARLVAVVLGMTGLFIPIWLAMIVQGIRSGIVSETALVFVLDLAFLIPACLYAAILVWRRNTFGEVISGPLLFKAALSGMLLTGGEIMKLAEGLPPAWDQLALYVFLATVGLFTLARYLVKLEAPTQKPTQTITWLPLGHRSD